MPGNLTAFSHAGGDQAYSAGSTSFSDASNAGSATFTNNGSNDSLTPGSSTSFSGNSTAANGTFINNGGTLTAFQFGGGVTAFKGTSTAGNSTLIAKGTDLGDPGIISFLEDSTGGTARVEVFVGTGDLVTYGNLDIRDHNTPGVTIGSIEGDGEVHLGANNLTVGSNNLSTIFSGVIDGIGGSLTKIGGSTLALTGANTYTAGTTIDGGKLVVSNTSGSGTGAGPVQVNAGILGGGGTIAGPVTVGNGSGARAILAPGGREEDKAGTLTVQSALIFSVDATYKWQLKAKRAIADSVVANGVTINGARAFFAFCGNSVLPSGSVFTMIDNTAATLIAGTFRNLADGSIFTAGSNTFLVNYEGGDGNDLTLTVLPQH